MTDRLDAEPGTTAHGKPAWDPDRLPEKWPWMLRWHVPRFLKGLVPRIVVQGVRDLKGRALGRDFPRHVEFTQSSEDAQASASFSIVVAIHDAPTVTRRCLASLEKYAPESEVILVDDGSKLTETQEVIRHFTGRGGWKIVWRRDPIFAF